MRQSPSALNRAWLVVLGLLLTLAGAAGLVIGLGQASGLLRSVGLAGTPPQPGQQLLGTAAQAAFGLTWVVLVVAAVGVVVALLGLGWLLAQIPRTNPARPFRLQDDAHTGLTRVAPSVLVRAVEEQTTRLPGVTKAAAVVRGTAAQPELVLHVTADDRTDLRALLARLQDEVAGDLGQALDTRVARFGVALDVTAAKVSADSVVL